MAKLFGLLLLMVMVFGASQLVQTMEAVPYAEHAVAPLLENPILLILVIGLGIALVMRRSRKFLGS